MFVILKEGEHSNSLQVYICFHQRSINKKTEKNYFNISIADTDPIASLCF